MTHRSSWTTDIRNNNLNTDHAARMLRKGRKWESAEVTLAKREVSKTYNISMDKLDKMTFPEIADFIRSKLK